MKRAVCLLLSAALLLGVLSACRSPAEGSGAADLTAADLAGAALDHSGREDRDGLECLYAGEHREELEVYGRNAYQLKDPWEDMAVIRATGARVCPPLRWPWCGWRTTAPPSGRPPRS